LITINDEVAWAKGAPRQRIGFALAVSKPHLPPATASNRYSRAPEAVSSQSLRHFCARPSIGTRTQRDRLIRPFLAPMAAASHSRQVQPRRSCVCIWRPWRSVSASIVYVRVCPGRLRSGDGASIPAAVGVDIGCGMIAADGVTNPLIPIW